jgi:uncharacterized membrane protein
LARIFSVLALLAVLLLAANFFVGLAIGDFNAAAGQKRAAHARFLQLERQQGVAREASSSQLDAAKQALAKADAEFQTPRARMTLHMLLGSAAALVALLVNSIAVTYFIGTARWCKEVCETYRLRPELAERSTRLKRSTFPWALAGIVAVIGIVALGAAADPTGANFRHSASLVTPHYVAAMIGLVIVVASFWVQIVRIAENYAVIEEILDEVQAIREGQGGEVAEERWAAT